MSPNRPPHSNRLALLRKAQGMDRAALAALCGVHERTVYRWETGESRIPDHQKALLCDHFGVSLDFLMGRKPDGNGDNGDVGEQEGAA